MSKQPSPAEFKKEKPLAGGQVTLDFTVRFEDLTFGRVLGQGGYGKVYEGEWKFNPVAIKQYTAQDFSETTRQEIRKEAMVMATVSTQSDYLVRLRGMILEKPHYSLVMEYMPGGDLFHLLKSSQELTWSMRYRISLDMTIGLHHLHGYGGLHRDLKSLNVLLDMNFRAKLADFGLSTLKTSSASSTAGGFKGTALWSAPELFKRGAKATIYSDIYSLGMVFWELVSRQIPFADAATPVIAMDWVKSGEQENIPEGTPKEFKTIILDCWNKEPEQRPAAAEVAKRLDTLWQAERKKAPTTRLSPASSASGSASASISSDSVMIPTLADSSALPAKSMPIPSLSKLPASVQKPLSQSSQILMPTPKPVIPRLDREIQPVDQKALNQLLEFVVEGEQDKAEALIQKDKNLLLHAGTVTDLSGREFKQITAFQYALWSMDWHMWTMIQKYLPKEAQAEQLQALETKGTTHGNHFSLKGLTDALQVYVDNAEKWNYDQRAETQWYKVGVEQNKLPAQVVNEYCRGDRPFYPCPQEWESKLPRTREMDVWDSTRSKTVKGSWFIAPSSKDRLGLNFAFYRDGAAAVRGRQVAAPRAAQCADLKALQSLWKTRTQQLELLKSELLPAASYSQVLVSSR